MRAARLRKLLPRLLLGVALLAALFYLRSLAANQALIVAAQTDNASALQAALSGGADVSTRNTLGWSALMEAATDGSADSVQVLLAHGADVNAADSHGWTPLMIAVLHGKIEVARVLL